MKSGVKDVSGSGSVALLQRTAIVLAKQTLLRDAAETTVFIIVLMSVCIIYVDRKYNRKCNTEEIQYLRRFDLADYRF